MPVPGQAPAARSDQWAARPRWRPPAEVAATAAVRAPMRRTERPGTLLGGRWACQPPWHVPTAPALPRTLIPLADRGRRRRARRRDPGQG